MISVRIIREVCKMDIKKRNNGTSVRNFRRLLYGALGVVFTSYLILFVMVISRHLDQTAEDELRQAAADSLNPKSRSRPAPKDIAMLANGHIGMERFQERWAAVSRILKVEQYDPAHPRRKVQMCSRPKFQTPPGPMIALASFPGSGNTWLRFLVQQATGYLTGSIYRDYSLKRNGFPAENIANGSVLMVKTHDWGKDERNKYQKAVLLLREPRDALLAEFNRRAGGHVGYAAPEKFHKGNAWRTFVARHSEAWLESTLDWLQYRGPLIILHYEIMLTNLPAELIKLLKFLDVNVTWPTFQCVLRNKDGIFRRARRPLQFNPFDKQLSAIMDECKDKVKAAIKLRELGIKFDIHNITSLNALIFNSNHTADSASGSAPVNKKIDGTS